MFKKTLYTFLKIKKQGLRLIICILCTTFKSNPWQEVGGPEVCEWQGDLFWEKFFSGDKAIQNGS